MKIDGKNFSYLNERGEVAGEAILFMRSQPLNSDGSLGYMVEPGTGEWLAWEAYFDQIDTDEFGVMVDRFPQQKRMFHAHGQQRRSYMVPAQLPWLFDPNFSQNSIKHTPRPRMSKDMTPGEIQLMMQRITKRGNDPTRLRNQCRQNWESGMYRLAPSPDAREAFIAILAQRPDLCERATDAEHGRYGMGWGAIAAEVTGLYWSSRNHLEAAE